MEPDIPEAILRAIYETRDRRPGDVFSICAPTLQAAAEIASESTLIQGDNWNWCKTCEHIAKEGL